MIPKIIHYCWFGKNLLPKSAKECIASWKKFFPDYEIKEWNEDNFNINITTYTAEAYKAKKYAFVSDYARFWILYNYGGLYFDTDVEVLKPMDDIMAKGGFMGMEKAEGSTLDNFDNNTILIAPGLGLAVEKGHTFYKEILEIYNKKHFINAIMFKLFQIFETQIISKQFLIFLHLIKSLLRRFENISSLRHFQR